MKKALNGIRVLELASYVAGPFSTMILADAGAEVIKIERPEKGDEFRYWGKDDYSPTFCAINRNKKSLTLNLASEQGKVIFLDLVKQSDILVENFRPGVMERLNLDYPTLKSINPGLIYCSITGFGESGPYHSRPGYDTVGQALSGILSLFTNFDSPQPMGISVSDHITALYASFGILIALQARKQYGIGQRVETSLLESSISFIGENFSRYMETGEIPERASRTHLAQVYCFVAKDGLPFIIHLSSPTKFWEGLTNGIGKLELRQDERFIDRKARIAHYTELHALLSIVFKNEDRSYWLNRMADNDVPCAPINNLEEVFQDPQVRHLDLIRLIRHPITGKEMKLIRNGVTLTETPIDTVSAPPLHGGQTEEILTHLGIEPDEIRKLQANGIV